MDTLNKLRIEKEGTEEEATEQLTAEMDMEVEEEGEDKEEGEGTQRELGAL